MIEPSFAELLTPEHLSAISAVAPIGSSGGVADPALKRPADLDVGSVFGRNSKRR